MTQTAALLQLLRAGPVTPLQALDELGCFRLAARVWDLRRDGYLIVNIPLRVGSKTVACYHLFETYPIEPEPPQVSQDGLLEPAAVPGQEEFWHD